MEASLPLNSVTGVVLSCPMYSFSVTEDVYKRQGQMTRLLFHFSAMAMMFYQWGLFSLSWWWIVIALSLIHI